MSKKCNCEFLHDIDMFGKDPEFYYKGRNKRTTLVGRICSILFVAVYIAFFIYKLIKMLQRVDVTFYDTFAFTGETPFMDLTNDNFYGGFGIMDANGDTFVDESIYYARAFFYSGKKENADVSFIKDSLEELLSIFRQVLHTSFNGGRYKEYNLAYW